MIASDTLSLIHVDIEIETSAAWYFAREDRNNLANPSSLQATIDCKVIGLQTVQTSSGLYYEHEHGYSR